MGINGLLKAIEGVQQNRHIAEYSGLRVAVDAHGWLHAGLFASALELATGRSSRAHIKYCLRRAAMLKRSGIDPVLVFDGRDLPAKQATNEARQTRRMEQRSEGERRLQNGDSQGARACFAQAIDVSSEMVDDLISELGAAGVEYLVAPYEADSQMAYLSLQGLADVCISEDSDLLAMGCARVLYKMNNDGQGTEICLDDALGGRSMEEFQAACVLMGCDYLPRIPGVGPRTAARLVDQCGSNPRMIASGAAAAGFDVPSNYAEDFANAIIALCHQTVLDPVSGRMVPLRPFPKSLAADPPYEILGPPPRKTKTSFRGHRQQLRTPPRHPSPVPLADSTQCPIVSSGKRQSQRNRSLHPSSHSREQVRHPASGPRQIHKPEEDVEFVDGEGASTESQLSHFQDHCPDEDRRAVETKDRSKRSLSPPEQNARRRRRRRNTPHQVVATLGDDSEDGDASALVSMDSIDEQACQLQVAPMQYSPFVSDSWVAPQMCRQPRMSLDEFIQRERSGWRCSVEVSCSRTPPRPGRRRRRSSTKLQFRPCDADSRRGHESAPPQEGCRTKAHQSRFFESA